METDNTGTAYKIYIISVREMHSIVSLQMFSTIQRCATRQMGAAAEQLRRRQLSGLVLTPVLLQTALHSAVRLAMKT